MVRHFYWRGILGQPFGTKFFRGIWCVQPGKFLNKTVMVTNNDVDSAFFLMNRLMEREGMLKIIRNTRYYLKPYMQRKELAREASRAIVREDQECKVRFLMRKKKVNSHPGQMTA